MKHKNPLKNYRETKQSGERIEQSIKDLKTEIKKSQMGTTLEIENLGKRLGVIDSSITNRIQVIEDRITIAEDTIENLDTRVKENAKC